MNALHFAAMHNATLCANILLIANCSPDVSNSTTSSTPLRIAAKHGQIGIVKELLSFAVVLCLCQTASNFLTKLPLCNHFLHMVLIPALAH